VAYTDLAHFERQTRISPSSPGTVPEVSELKVLNFSVPNLRVSECSIKGMTQSRFDDWFPVFSEHPPIGVGHPPIFVTQLFEH